MKRKNNFDKTCNSCNTTKNISKFRKFKQDPIESTCNTCRGIISPTSVELKQRLVDKKKQNGICRYCSKPKLPHHALCEHDYYKDVAWRVFGNTEFTQALKDLMEKQNYKCFYTQEKLIPGLNTSIEHYLPVSKYPELSQDINNLRWVTKQVNRVKNNLLPEELYKFSQQYIIFYESNHSENLLNKHLKKIINVNN